jgi:polyphosphate kinase
LSGSDAFGRDTAIAIVKAPHQLLRVIELPTEVAPPGSVVLLASIIHAHLGELFAGRRVVGYSQFRVTRDADLWFDEEEVKNLRQALEGELPQRQFGLAVRLEVGADCAPELAQLLLRHFELDAPDLYRCDGPVNLARLATLVEGSDRTELKYPPFVPGIPERLREQPDLLAAIRQHDVLLHHPYQAFDPVVEFIRKASDDPDVVAIKQTVYRTGVNSVLMDLLIEAARRGKEVTVVVELLARFDEEANINWAERLEAAGAQVVYGVFGLKTHAKLALLLRRERDASGRLQLRPYAHLGTGNYHPRTARQYTDFGLLTVNSELCTDVAEVFLHITSLARSNRLKRLWLAPFTMHRQLLAAIHRETRHAKEGGGAHIMAKMNGLVEEAVIKALYAASQAGVKIDLIVRGPCALRPGVKGWSDHIRVRSIVGRFLEHPRIWYFRNGGREDVYLSSADWMGRNLFRRIEVAFPVLDKELKARVVAEGLLAGFECNGGAWDLGADGEYHRAQPARRGHACSTQELLLDRLAERPVADR